MDEEIKKPFPIEFIVILLAVAVANDIAEIFFDLLDFTGVGVSGEAIMEPIDFVLDLFFTGFFVWRIGFGGATVTQYIDDLLEPLLIPGRTISVGLGLWIANHPNSAVSQIATTASSLESGNVEGALGQEAEGAASAVGKEAEGAAAGREKALQGGGAGGAEAEGAIDSGEAKTSGEKTSPSESGRSESLEGEGGNGEAGEKPPEKDELASPEEGNPTENLQEQLLEETQEEGAPEESEPEEEANASKKVFDISRHRPQAPGNESDNEEENINEDLPKAA